MSNSYKKRVIERDKARNTVKEATKALDFLVEIGDYKAVAKMAKALGVLESDSYRGHYYYNSSNGYPIHIPPKGSSASDYADVKRVADGTFDVSRMKR